jgi:hypothetical protein
LMDAGREALTKQIPPCLTTRGKYSTRRGGSADEVVSMDARISIIMMRRRNDFIRFLISWMREEKMVDFVISVPSVGKKAFSLLVVFHQMPDSFLQTV